MIITKTEKIKYGLDNKEDNKKMYIAEDKKGHKARRESIEDRTRIKKERKV